MGVSDEGWQQLPIFTTKPPKNVDMAATAKHTRTHARPARVHVAQPVHASIRVLALPCCTLTHVRVHERDYESSGKGGCTHLHAYSPPHSIVHGSSGRACARGRAACHAVTCAIGRPVHDTDAAIASASADTRCTECGISLAARTRTRKHASTGACSQLASWHTLVPRHTCGGARVWRPCVCNCHMCVGARSLATTAAR